MIGCDAAPQKIGVNSTGLPFNSVMAIELNSDRTMNPMVNAGAIATTSLAPGETAEAKWRFIQEGLSRFAGGSLTIDQEVYESEAATNQRNRGIAKLLEGYGRLYFDALESTDVYTKQCSLNVTVKDLAVIGATLADGGVNPLNKERVVDPPVAKRLRPWPPPAIKAEWFADFFAKTRQQLIDRLDQALLWAINRPDGNQGTRSMERFE